MTSNNNNNNNNNNNKDEKSVALTTPMVKELADKSLLDLEARAKAITARELEIYAKRTAGSKRAIMRARKVLPLGVPSSFQAYDPHPIVVRHSNGSRMVVYRAVRLQLEHGSLYVTPSERNSEVGELLAERYGLPMWRYTNSGTEATMDAIRVARGATGRHKIVKIEGGYHGHHDEVMISTKPPLDQAGPADAPRSVPACLGITAAVLNDTVVVPFNNIVAMERALKSRDVACVIMEPVMENIGICLPIPGYLEAVREMTTRFGTLLIFDEVKTGITAGYGGATNVLGVRPDLIALAKSIGGGFPFGAFGGKQEYMDLITQNKVLHLGTYNGNPLVMAATKATLTEACTRDAVEVAIARNTRLTQSCDDVVREFQLPAHTVQFGAKGCVTWSTTPVHNYRDYKKSNFVLAYAQWIHGINRGVLLPPGLDEQWLVSVMHDDEDAQRFAHVFREFAQDLRSNTPVASLESKLVPIRSRL